MLNGNDIPAVLNATSATSRGTFYLEEINKPPGAQVLTGQQPDHQTPTTEAQLHPH